MKPTKSKTSRDQIPPSGANHLTRHHFIQRTAVASAATAFGIGISIRDAQAAMVDGVTGYSVNVPAGATVNVVGATTPQDALVALATGLTQ